MQERDERPEGRGKLIERRASGLTGRIGIIVLVSALVFSSSLLPSFSPAISACLAIAVGLTLWANSRRSFYEDLSSRDTLTGLHNKGANDADLERLTCKGLPYTVFFMDVDRFKLINDNHGHAVGDAVLLDFSRSIVHFTQPGDCAYRVGGDEFVVVSPREMDAGQCDEVAEQIRQALEHPVRCGSCTIHPRTSVGFARYPADGASGAEVRDAADRMMYERKERRHAQEEGTDGVRDAKERLQGFDFYSASMAMPVPLVVLLAEEPYSMLFVNEAAIGLFAAKDHDDLFGRAGSSFLARVYEEDVAHVSSLLEADETRKGICCPSRVEYRIVDLDGEVHAITCGFAVVKGMKHGPLLYALLCDTGTGLSSGQ